MEEGRSWDGEQKEDFTDEKYGHSDSWSSPPATLTNSPQKSTTSNLFRAHSSVFNLRVKSITASLYCFVWWTDLSGVVRFSPLA